MSRSSTFFIFEIPGKMVGWMTHNDYHQNHAYRHATPALFDFILLLSLLPERLRIFGGMD